MQVHPSSDFSGIKMADNANGTPARRQAIYSDRAVGFIDILGFGELVKRAHNNPELRQQIIAALEEVRSVRNAHFGKAELRTHNFSDSLILSATNDELGIVMLLASIKTLIYKLLDLGIFVRGAVTVGGVYHDDHVVFGVGVNEAYRLESSIAQVPRVILGKGIVDRMKAASASSLLDLRIARRGEDGVWHLDPFFGLEGDIRSSADLQLATKRLSSIQQIIQQQLDETMEHPGIFSKIEWIAKEWNRHLPQWRERQISVGRVTSPGQEREKRQLLV